MRRNVFFHQLILMAFMNLNITAMDTHSKIKDCFDVLHRKAAGAKVGAGVESGYAKRVLKEIATAYINSDYAIDKRKHNHNHVLHSCILIDETASLSI